MVTWIDAVSQPRSDPSGPQISTWVVPMGRQFSGIKISTNWGEDIRPSTAPNNGGRTSCKEISDLPGEILDSIFAKLPYEYIGTLKLVSKLFKARTEGDGFCHCRESLRPREALLTLIHFTVCRDGIWQCTGYDLDTQAWRRLPPFAVLPHLNSKLFKDNSLSASGRLLCAFVVEEFLSTPASQEKLIVFNPMTGRWRELPPFNHPRHPVLMHLVVAPSEDSFKVVIAGSAKAGDQRLSQVTEVFDSRTSTWIVTEDVPGPPFALNEHQHGAYIDGILYCVAFLEHGGQGLLAYIVAEGKWLSTCRFQQTDVANLNIVQVANIHEEVVVFSEAEHNPTAQVRAITHSIDILENPRNPRRRRWKNLVTERKGGNHAGLQIYPEFSCVAFEEGKLCLFNNVAHTGVIYDIKTGRRTGKLRAPTWDGRRAEQNFYTLNPPSFTFEPSFTADANLGLTNSWPDTPSFAIGTRVVPVKPRYLNSDI